MLFIAAIAVIVILIGIIVLLIAAKRPFIVINKYNIQNMNQIINGNGNLLNTGSDSNISANIKMGDETNGESSRPDAKTNIRGRKIFNWCGQVLLSVLANILTPSIISILMFMLCHWLYRLVQFNFPILISLMQIFCL